MPYLTTTDTPAGPFSMVVDDDVVLATGWTEDRERLLAMIDDRLRPADVRRHTGHSAAADAVAAYCDGDLHAPDAIAVRQTSGPFITAAWEALRKVAPGEVITYSQLAKHAGRPGAVRAAGSACARNPNALFVPCHRVRRRDQTLGGFGWGLDIKRWLLGHEQAAAREGVLSG